MMEIIKPGTNFDFMGKHKIFLAISGALCLGSIVAMLTIGLNLGIEFKGGTKLIVTFKESVPVERAAIKQAIDDLVVREMGVQGTQIEVQDFGSIGADNEAIPTRKFLIYTELTTLVSAQKRQQVVQALKAKFGNDLVVDIPEASGDTFFLAFPKEAPIPERVEQIRSTLAAKPIEFSAVQVESDKARELELEHLRELNMIMAEGAGAQTPEGMSQEAFEERKQRQLAGLQDLRFTVRTEEIKTRVTDLLKKRFDSAFVAVDSSTIVSPSVGAGLLSDSILAMIYGFIGIWIYVALRFNFTFSPGAIIALIHDTLITAGVITVTQTKFTMTMVAVLLTIIGYSINDTIVIYDRIRELRDKVRGRALENTINAAVNETLGRTILTSLTVALVVFAMLFLGGGQIKDFAFAMTVGLVAGSYSTVFIASPFIIYLDRFFEKRKAKVAK